MAVFLAARTLLTRQLQWLCWLVLGMAAFQAVTGLVQYGGGLNGIALFEGATGASGTYSSRNNFAGFLLLALMPTLALLVATLGRRSTGPSLLRERLVFWSTLRGHRAFGFGALALLLLLGIVFSRSRAGISLTMLGVVLVGLLLSRRLGGRRGGFGPVSTVASIALGLAIAIGLAPVLQRFTLLDPVEDGRVTIFAGTLEGIRQFFPLGAGPATFQQAFFPFQDLEPGDVPDQPGAQQLPRVGVRRRHSRVAADRGDAVHLRRALAQAVGGGGLGRVPLRAGGLRPRPGADAVARVRGLQPVRARQHGVFRVLRRGVPARLPRAPVQLRQRDADGARSGRHLPPLQPPEATQTTNPFMD